MSMIKCPSCQKDVSSAAEACPNCGHPINSRPKWNPAIAMLCSFFIPGLGQVYRGNVFAGAAWFFLTLLGYFLFIFPGLAMHILCVLSAGLGNPRAVAAGTGANPQSSFGVGALVLLILGVVWFSGKLGGSGQKSERGTVSNQTADSKGGAPKERKRRERDGSPESKQVETLGALDLDNGLADAKFGTPLPSIPGMKCKNVDMGCKKPCLIFSCTRENGPKDFYGVPILKAQYSSTFESDLLANIPLEFPRKNIKQLLEVLIERYGPGRKMEGDLPVYFWVGKNVEVSIIYDDLGDRPISMSMWDRHLRGDQNATPEDIARSTLLSGPTKTPTVTVGVCGPGQTWTPGYTAKNGKVIEGHCRNKQ